MGVTIRLMAAVPNTQKERHFRVPSMSPAPIFIEMSWGAPEAIMFASADMSHITGMASDTAESWAVSLRRPMKYVSVRLYIMEIMVESIAGIASFATALPMGSVESRYSPFFM